ncbi:MAG TPA: DNA-deoxyinosine glycosylase, partial [Ruminococcaceae bacterium]|nr:DNA-deoxyinosine glycosylase [Oscillospiraceae bacterium]
VWNSESKILILGSFPSVKSREQMFFYGHPRNRFWTVIASLLDVDIPQTVEEKKTMLLNNNIALWDVIASCDIYGSADSSIKNAVANDIGFIIEKSKVERVFTNGATADKLYKKYILPSTGIEAVCLPSTSPANAAKSLDELVKDWAIVVDSI